jgi:manganese-dependent inorganic pyrophosphatase
MIYTFGHLHPDTDSIVASIAFAEYLNQRGEPATACALGAPNPESEFVLDKFALPAPERLDTAAGKQVAIVDTFDPAQMPGDLHDATIKYAVDHHQLAGLKTPAPLWITARPYGSTSTIITELFVAEKLKLSPNLAGALLCAILSDTVLFKSPTTTPADRAAAEMLASISGAEITELGMEMLRVKSDISNETASALLNRDMKEFDINELKLAIAQIELIDAEMATPFIADLQTEMTNLMKAKKLDGVILLITDIMKEGSYMLIAGSLDERIKKLFPSEIDKSSSGLTGGSRPLIWIPGLLSRKKQVIPVLTDHL